MSSILRNIADIIAWPLSDNEFFCSRKRRISQLTRTLSDTDAHPQSTPCQEPLRSYADNHAADDHSYCDRQTADDEHAESALGYINA